MPGAFQIAEAGRLPCGSNAAECRKCHPEDSFGSGLVIPRDACSEDCASCHSNLKTMHNVGAEVKAKLSPPLKLSSKSHVSCTSCHRLEGKRYDSVPWKAESLYDSLFRRKTVHKTYYLAMRNHKGQLCKVCH